MSCSKLDQAMAAQGSMVTNKKNKTKPRLVADPRVSASEIADVLRKFLSYKETTDIHAVLCPSKVLKLDWKHGLDPDWIVKCCALAYDLAELCPNSKLRGTKVREAIKTLLTSGEVRNSTGRSEKTFIDTCDMMIRVVMGQFRTMKASLDKREQVLRKVPKESAARIKLVLDRLLLPQEFQNSEDEDEEEVVIWGNEKKDDGFQLVPVEPVQDPASSAKPYALKTQPENDSYDIDIDFFKDIAEAPPAPITPDRKPAGATSGFSPSDNQGLQKPSRISSGSVGFAMKEEVEDVKVKSPRPAARTKVNPKAETLTDDALLAEATKYVSSAVQKKGGKKVLKKPSTMSKPTMKRPAAAAGADASVPAAVPCVPDKKKTKKD